MANTKRKFLYIRPFSHEGEFEVSDNLVDNFMIFYESDD